MSKAYDTSLFCSKSRTANSIIFMQRREPKLMFSNRVKNIFAAAVFTFLLAGAAQPASAVITVDGLISDWGVTPGPFSNGASQWTPGAGIDFIQEDQDPEVDFLGPGFGGQRFDVEAIYFTQQGPTAYFAVVSGFPLAGWPGYSAGDLAFDFGSDGS